MMNLNIENGFTLGEMDELLNGGLQLVAPLRTPVASAGRNSLSFDGHFANKAKNLAETLTKAGTLYGYASISDLDPEAAMLNELEPERAMPIDNAHPGIVYRTVTRTVKMVVCADGVWTVKAGTRRIETEEPVTSTVQQLQKSTTNPEFRPARPQYTVELRRPPQMQMIERKRPADTKPVPAPKVVHRHAVQGKRTRFCAHPGCNTEFLVLGSEPNAVRCRKHEQEHRRGEAARLSRQHADAHRLSARI